MCKLKKKAHWKKTVIFSTLKWMSAWCVRLRTIYVVYLRVNHFKFYTCFRRLHLLASLLRCIESKWYTVNYGLLSQSQLCQAVHLAMIHINIMNYLSIERLVSSTILSDHWIIWSCPQFFFSVSKSFNIMPADNQLFFFFFADTSIN